MICLAVLRPDYRKLGILKQQFPDVPLLALTATATHKVCADLQEMLRIPGCDVFRSCVNRPNLFYQARLSLNPPWVGPHGRMLPCLAATRLSGSVKSIVWCMVYIAHQARCSITGLVGAECCGAAGLL